MQQKETNGNGREACKHGAWQGIDKKNPVGIELTGLAFSGGRGGIQTTQYFRGFERLRHFCGFFCGYF